MPVYFCPSCGYSGDTHLASHCSHCRQALPPVAGRPTSPPAAAPAAAPSPDPFAVDPFTGRAAEPTQAGPPLDAFSADPFGGRPAPAGPTPDAFSADPFAGWPAPASPPPGAFTADPYTESPAPAGSLPEVFSVDPFTGKPLQPPAPGALIEDGEEDLGLGDPFAELKGAPPTRRARDEFVTGKFRASDLADPLQAPISKVEPGYDPAAVKAWLRCDPFDAVPVVKAMLTIGRSRDSDMILPHPSVSKTHAMVRALGDGLVIEDRSTYGTSVNGKRVTTSAIKPGDTLTLGPYTIEISAERFDTPADDDTRPLPKLESSEAMSGRVEKTALDEVLQQIEFYKKTGTLKVWTEANAGVLVLYEGRPMFAEWNADPPQADQDALFSMLSLDRGNFSFMAKVEAGEMTMSGTVTSLLMEYARTADEA